MAGTIRVQISTYEGNTTWEFPMKDSVLADKLQSIGCKDQIPISSVIWPEGLHMLNGLKVSADELNFLAKSIDRYVDSEYDQFMAAASLEKSPDLERLINISLNTNHYTVVRDVSDLSGIGKYHLINIQGSLTKDELETVDFAQVGRDLLTSGKGIPTDYGLLFENEEVPFQQVYDGTTFPPYLYKGSEVAIVKMDYQGRTEYLYLPEEDITIEKAMKRLGAPCLDDCFLDMETFNCLDECWQNRLETNFLLAGFHEANYLAEVLTWDNLDLHKLLCVTDHAAAVRVEDIKKLADHLDDFIFIKGAETPADVGEYITQHELSYEAGEDLVDFIDYHKLGEFIMQERNGEFLYGSFVCMEDGCDFEVILHEQDHEIELGGM